MPVLFAGLFPSCEFELVGELGVADVWLVTGGLVCDCEVLLCACEEPFWDCVELLVCD